MDTFCSSLVHFPNIHHLDISPAIFDDDENGRPLDTSSFKKQENMLEKVTKISFGSGLKHPESVKYFLELVPKLEEIHGFPVLLVDALFSKEMASKACRIKSITYPGIVFEGDESEEDIQNDDRVQIAFKKFALLAPKLLSFSFGMSGIHDPDRSVNEDCFYRQTFHPDARHILESSYLSLEDLTICLQGNFNFNSVPPMTSLKKIKLIVVTNFSWDEIPLYLRSQIEEIILVNYNGNTSDEIRALGNSFGSLKRLTFNWIDDVDQLEPIFSLIAEFWPELEVLIIELEGSLTSLRTFDSVFTGISDYILTQLKDPFGRDEFMGDAMDSFYANSALMKLSKLKKLELNLEYSAVPWEALNQKLRTITSLSKEFCFDSMSSTFQLVISGLLSDITISPSTSEVDLEEALSDVATFDGSPKY